MKKVLFLALAALGIAGLSGLSTNVQAARAETNYIYGDNIIYNGDFAIGPNEVALTSKTVNTATWTNWANLEATQVVTQDPTNPSNTVLRFSTYEGAGFASMYILMSNIQPGETYDISFDFYAPAACDNVGVAFWCTSLNNRLPEVNVLWQEQLDAAGGVITDSALGEGWRHVAWSRTFDAAQTYDSAHIWCNVGAGSVYFDNLTATIGGDATTELFAGGDFTGWLSDASATVPSDADEHGIHGEKATYVYGGVELEANGYIAYDVNFSEDKYALYTEFVGGENVDVEMLGLDGHEGLQLANEVTSWQVDGELTNATGIKFVNNGTETITISRIEVKPVYESSYDPNTNYYESESLTVNGDFEAFEVGTVMSETQLEGAWGSVSLDNVARISEVDGSKAATFGKHDETDSKNFSSMFLMTPEGLAIGDILRLKYDFKLTLSDEADSYAEINSCFVGGGNVPYYKVDFGVLNPQTSGAEKARFDIDYEQLGNDWVRVTVDFEVSNDIIQWNSVRWLFTPHNVGDLVAIDNVNLYYLSETPFTNPVTSIEIVEGDQVLEAGATKQLTYTVNPSDHDETTFTWSSSNTAVATVDASGKVTAVAEGSAEITITAENGVKASIIVTVTAAPAPQGGGCGGSIVAASLIVSLSALAGVAGIIISKKRKED